MSLGSTKEYNIFMVTFPRFTPERVVGPRVVGFFDIKDPNHQAQIEMALRTLGPKYGMLAVYGTRARDKERILLTHVAIDERGHFCEVTVPSHPCDSRLGSAT